MIGEKVSVTVERTFRWFARVAQERSQRERRRLIVAEDLAAHGPIADEVREDVLRQWPHADR
jgi:hypothetical protein